MKNLGVQGVHGVHGFQRKISNGAFHPVAVAKDRTETEKFPPVHFQPGGRGKKLCRNGKISTDALSARWPWQKTAPKRKNFHQCPSARWPWQKTAPKLKSFHRCTFSSVSVAKKRARRALHTFGTCADKSICLTFLRFRQGSFRGQKAVSM